MSTLATGSPKLSASPSPADVVDWLEAQAADLAGLIYDALADALTVGAKGFRTSLDVAAFDRFPADWRAFCTEVVLPRIALTYDAAFSSMTAPSLIGQSLDPFDTKFINERAVDYARAAAGRFAQVGEEVHAALPGLVAQHVHDGSAPRDLAKQLRDEVGLTPRSAMTIARTEMVGAYTNGDRAGAESLAGDDRPVEHVWQATNDRRTRPSHAAADQQTRRFDEPFSVGGASMMHPHAAGAPAAEVVNCRCVELYLYPGDTRPDGSIVDEKIGPTAPAAAPAPPKTLPEFPQQPWATHAEARAYLEAHHPHLTWGEDMADWDRRVVHESARFADDMQTLYPDDWQKMRYFGSQTGGDVPPPGAFDWRRGDGVFAHAYVDLARLHGRGIIGINPKYARDYDKWLRMKGMANDTKWVFGSTPHDTMVHEFGHVLDGLADRNAADFALAHGSSTGFGSIDAAGTTDYFNIRQWLAKSYAKPKMKAWGSTYGAKNEREAIAESFNMLFRDPTHPAAAPAAALRDLVASLDPTAHYDPGFGSSRDLVGRLRGMDQVDEILNRHGISARPKGWASEKKALRIEVNAMQNP